MAPDNVADNSGDVVVTDQQLYDHAVSEPTPSSSPAAPAEAPAPQQEPGPTPQQPAPTVPRDDQGRFAPKQPPQPQQPQQRTPEDHRVPLRDLLDERERRQRIEAEATQMRQAWAQFQAAQQAAAAQQQTPQTIFDAPDEYLQNRVMNPLRQEGQMYMLKVKDDMSRYQANQQHGEQVVNAALSDLTQIRNSPQGDFVFRQIMQTGHPYDALVRWHSQARAQQAIGPNPHAWLRKQQQQWINDPQVQAEAAKRYYARQQQQGAGRPPQVNLPPSLSTMPASSGRIDDQGDLSNESLYRFATK
jgi:hypothetical protein